MPSNRVSVRIRLRVNPRPRPASTVPIPRSSPTRPSATTTTSARPPEIPLFLFLLGIGGIVVIIFSFIVYGVNNSGDRGKTSKGSAIVATATPPPTGDVRIYPTYVFCRSEGVCDTPWKDSLDTYCLEPIAGTKDPKFDYCSHTKLDKSYYWFFPIPVGEYTLLEIGPGPPFPNLGRIKVIPNSTVSISCKITTLATVPLSNSGICQ